MPLPLFGRATALLLLLVTGSAAAGFIDMATRRDIAYDDQRGVLYISADSAWVFRYHLESGAFLDPVPLNYTPFSRASGLDISPDGNSLAVADRDEPVIHIVNLQTLAAAHVEFEPAFGEAGTYTVAYAADGAILVTSTFDGSGTVPLRRYDPATGSTSVVHYAVRQNAMLAASADRRVIAVGEDSYISRYRVSDRSFRTTGSGAPAFEIGVRRDGRQFAMPYFTGTEFADADLVRRPEVVGDDYHDHPIAAAYDPVRDLVYLPWKDAQEVRVYDAATLTPVGAYPISTMAFELYGNSAFVQGRTRISRDGLLLFTTVRDGIEFIALDLAPPSGLNAFAGNGAVELKWLPSPGATSYIVEQGVSADATVPVQNGVTGNAATISSLSNGTTYYFKVLAQTPGGDTGPSAAIAATPGESPSMPTGLSASGRSHSARLGWQAVAGATTYNVYMSTTADGQVTPVLTGVAGTTATIEDLDDGTRYYFKVAAVNASGSGPLSAEATATPGKGSGGGGGLGSLTLLGLGFAGIAARCRRNSR